MKEFWQSFVHFLTEYDIQKTSSALRNVNWLDLLTSPMAWVVAIPVILLAVWRRQIHFLILAVSLVVFAVVLQNILPPAGESIPLSNLMEFIAVSVGLVVVNGYFFFVREK